MIYPADSAIHRLNNWGLVSLISRKKCPGKFAVFSSLRSLKWISSPESSTYLAQAPKNSVDKINSVITTSFISNSFISSSSRTFFLFLYLMVNLYLATADSI